MKKNPENEKKIASLISEMTLEEKVLQMFQISNVAEYPEGTYENSLKRAQAHFSMYSARMQMRFAMPRQNAHENSSDIRHRCNSRSCFSQRRSGISHSARHGLLME